MTVPKCTSWLGHKFEGRYSIGAPDLSVFDSLEGRGALALVEMMKAKTYECDICVRCGHVVLPTPPQDREATSK